MGQGVGGRCGMVIPSIALAEQSIDSTGHCRLPRLAHRRCCWRLRSRSRMLAQSCAQSLQPLRWRWLRARGGGKGQLRSKEAAKAVRPRTVQ